MPSSNPFSLPNNRPNLKIWNGNAARRSKTANGATEDPVAQAVVVVRLGGTAPTALLSSSSLSAVPATLTPPTSAKRRPLEFCPCSSVSVLPLLNPDLSHAPRSTLHGGSSGSIGSSGSTRANGQMG